jgi:hypothetical protein
LLPTKNIFFYSNEKKRVFQGLFDKFRILLTNFSSFSPLQFFEKDNYLFKFDLKSGDHHFDICPQQQTYLGFSWENKFCCFSVLVFGLASSPYLFSKCKSKISLILPDLFVATVSGFTINGLNGTSYAHPESIRSHIAFFKADLLFFINILLGGFKIGIT